MNETGSCVYVDKSTFGWPHWNETLSANYKWTNEIKICGLCTDFELYQTALTGDGTLVLFCCILDIIRLFRFNTELVLHGKFEKIFAFDFQLEMLAVLMRGICTSKRTQDFSWHLSVPYQIIIKIENANA